MESTSTSATSGEHIPAIILQCQRLSPDEREAMLVSMTREQLCAILAYGMVDLFAGEEDGGSCSSEIIQRIHTLLRKKDATVYHWPPIDL